MEIKRYTLKKFSRKKCFSRMSSRILILMASVCLFLTFAGFGCGNYWMVQTHSFKSYDKFHSIFEDVFLFPTVYPEGLDPREESFTGEALGRALLREDISSRQRPKRDYTTKEDTHLYAWFSMYTFSNKDTYEAEPYFSQLRVSRDFANADSIFNSIDKEVYAFSRDLKNTTLYYNLHNLSEYIRNNPRVSIYASSEYGYFLEAAFVYNDIPYDISLILTGDIETDDENKEAYQQKLLDAGTQVIESMKP